MATLCRYRSGRLNSRFRNKGRDTPISSSKQDQGPKIEGGRSQTEAERKSRSRDRGRETKTMVLDTECNHRRYLNKTETTTKQLGLRAPFFPPLLHSSSSSTLMFTLG